MSPDLGPLLRHRRWMLASFAARIGAGVDGALGHPVIRRSFRKRHGYPLNLRAPRTHNERILVRKLFDRDPRFPAITDKLAVREAVRGILGPDLADRLLVPVLAEAERFEDLPDSLWTRDVMVKCAHGSGMNVAVPAGDSAAREGARRKVGRWMRKVHGASGREWAYVRLPPRILAEPLLPAARDLKLYFYDGRLRFVMPEDNGGARPGVAMYTPDWQEVAMSWPAFDHSPAARPARLEEMAAIGARLARGFDMLRVDFLLSGETMHLGELTLYDGGGMCAFGSRAEDLAFARYWQQPHLGAQR